MEEFGKMIQENNRYMGSTVGMSRDELQNQLITQQKNEEMIGKYGETGSKVMGFISAEEHPRIRWKRTCYPIY